MCWNRVIVLIIAEIYLISVLIVSRVYTRSVFFCSACLNSGVWCVGIRAPQSQWWLLWHGRNLPLHFQSRVWGKIPSSLETLWLSVRKWSKAIWSWASAVWLIYSILNKGNVMHLWLILLDSNFMWTVHQMTVLQLLVNSTVLLYSVGILVCFLQWLAYLVWVKSH